MLFVMCDFPLNYCYGFMVNVSIHAKEKRYGVVFIHDVPTSALLIKFYAVNIHFIKIGYVHCMSYVHVCRVAYRLYTPYRVKAYWVLHYIISTYANSEIRFHLWKCNITETVCYSIGKINIHISTPT